MARDESGRLTEVETTQADGPGEKFREGGDLVDNSMPLGAQMVPYLDKTPAEQSAASASDASAASAGADPQPPASDGGDAGTDQ